jgi:signal transduction histidine kinase
MSERTESWLAGLAFGSTSVVYLATLVLALINRATDSAPVAQRDAANLGSVVFFSAMLLFGFVGLLIASHRSRNKIAWIFLAIALSWQLWWFGANYLQYGIVTNPGSVPSPAVVGALTSWLWAPAIGLMGTFLILLFPDGKLPSHRWRPLARLSALALLVASLVDLFQPGSFTNMGFPGVRNPLGIEALRPVLTVLAFTVVLIPFCMIGCAISLIGRFRRSDGMRRVQLKWLVAAAAIVALSYVILWAVSIPFVSDPTPPLWVQAVSGIALLSFALIPIAAGIAILKHRLFDIDIVINKALVFGALAAFITAVYVAIVVGIGRIVGSGDRPNLALSITATAIVAVAFQPVRERVQGFANRLVYGQRLTPYEVLTRFSRSVGALVSVEDVLPQIARHTTEGLAAERTVVTALLDNGNEAVSFPQDAPAGAGAEEVVAVTYRNEPVGSIAVTKEGVETFTGQERRLLEQLAAQAGVVLHNYRLAVELRRRLDELSAQSDALEDSRERLVTAADTSRRAIEQAIREGVEGRLQAMATDLDAAEAAVEKDPQAAAGLLEGLSTRTNETLEALRDLARGIYPPLLVDKGLVVALEAHIRKTGLEVDLQIEDSLASARFDRSIETSCYFCLRETLDNVGRHARGARATVALMRRGERLVFRVNDEGPGFDVAGLHSGGGLQAMRDRVAAAGGELAVESRPGQGTTVSGWVPLAIEETSANRPYEAVAVAQASSS